MHTTTLPSPMLSLVVGRKKENGGAHCHPTLMGLWLRYHIADYNSCCSCCSNVKEREEGGGAPFSSFLGVCDLFFWWCFRVAMARVEKEEEKGKEARKKRKRKQVGGVAVERTKL